jgi:protein PhnA
MSDSVDAILRARGSEKCELCGASSGLVTHAVGPDDDVDDATRCVLVCDTCAPQLDVASELDVKHWFCLKESVWSDVPAVQVVSYRLLERMPHEGWATDLLGQVYLDDAVLAWAQAGASASGSGADVPTLDSNGAVLADGDSVTLIKDLDVKGTTFVAKRGTLVKNIRLIPDDPDNVEGRVNKIGLVLKTCFLKKSS